MKQKYKIFGVLIILTVLLTSCITIQTVWAGDAVVNIPGTPIYNDSTTKYARTTSSSGKGITASLTTQHFDLSNISSITIQFKDASNRGRGDWIKGLSNSHKAYAIIDEQPIEIEAFETDVVDLELEPFRAQYGNLSDVYWEVSAHATYYNLWQSSDYYNDGLTVGLSVSVGKIYGPSFTSNLPSLN